MSDTPTPASGGNYSAEFNGFDLESTQPIGDWINSHPDAQAKPEADEPKPEADAAEPDVSKAASTLGKRGGEAAAAKRAAEKEAKADEGDDADEATRKVAEEIQQAPKDKRKQLASERVGEATRAAKQAREELEREKRERAAERAELERLRTERAAPRADDKAKPDEDAEPTEDQFDTIADFVKAHGKWASRQAAKETRESIRHELEEGYKQTVLRQRATAHTQQVVGRVEAYRDRMKTALADTTIAEAIEQSEVYEFTPTYILPPDKVPHPKNMIADEIVESDDPGAIMYHFATNPDDVERIVDAARKAFALGQDPTDGLSLGHRAIAREIAKLEKSFDKAKAAATAGTPAPKPEVSKANPPVRPVTGPPAVADGLYREGMDIDEYADKWNKTVRPRLFQR